MVDVPRRAAPRGRRHDHRLNFEFIDTTSSTLKFRILRILNTNYSTYLYVLVLRLKTCSKESKFRVLNSETSFETRNVCGNSVLLKSHN